MLFDVNTTRRSWRAYPLFAVWSNAPGDGYSAAFTGKVDGVEYYDIQGVARCPGAVPTWAMLLFGFAGPRLCRISPGQDERRSVGRWSPGQRACREHDLPLEELDVRLNGFGWEDSWDNFTGPQAKAHHLLKGLDLGDAGSALRQAGQIIFEEFGGSPGNSYTWVELRDDLTVSLLQARLIELNLPINVAVGTRD